MLRIVMISLSCLVLGINVALAQSTSSSNKKKVWIGVFNNGDMTISYRSDIQTNKKGNHIVWVNVKYHTVTLNDDVLNQLHELEIIAKGSTDKAELTEANIPAIFTYNGTKYKITSIGEEIFKECTLLKTVTIPDSVTTIEKGAFDSCSSLEDVTIGNSVETLGNGAFYNCTSLKEIIIPDSVTTINRGAFSGCRYLETVTLGNNLTTIESGAFSGCTSLKEIVIPDSVTTIKGGAFAGCTNSELTIAIPDSVTTIEGGAFFNVPEITYTSKMKATGSPWGAKKVNGVVVQQ